MFFFSPCTSRMQVNLSIRIISASISNNFACYLVMSWSDLFNLDSVCSKSIFCVSLFECESSEMSSSFKAVFNKLFIYCLSSSFGLKCFVIFLMQSLIKKTNATDASGNIVLGDVGVLIQQEVGDFIFIFIFTYFC